MLKKFKNPSFLLCLLLSFHNTSHAATKHYFYKHFYINHKNWDELFEEDSVEKKNLTKYFNWLNSGKDALKIVEGATFSNETMDILRKEASEMREDTKKQIFINYCKIIEECCFSNLDMLSEEDEKTGTRSIKIDHSKFKSFFSKYSINKFKKHSEILLIRALSHSLTYLLHTETIRNPHKHEEISEDDIKVSIQKINDSQKEKNYGIPVNSQEENPVTPKEGNDEEVVVKYIPNKKRIKEIGFVINAATDNQRYATVAGLGSSPMKPIAMNTSQVAISLFDKLWKKCEENKDKGKFTEAHYRQECVGAGLTASSFDPRALYGVLSYIRDNTAETKFEKRGPFETFYDPCGGWGERFFAAALAKEDNFTTIKVNDLNHDLKEGYEKLKKRYEDFCKENNLKNITFTYEDALKNESNQGAETNDFIFTGLPFFNQEQYPHMNFHMNADSPESGPARSKGARKKADSPESGPVRSKGARKKADSPESGPVRGKGARKKWLEEWTVPLIEKLIESLSPGGILAFNIGSTDQMPLAHELGTFLAGSENYSETRSCGKGSSIFGQSFEGSKIFKENITDYTKKLWGKILYGVKSAKGAYSPIIILQKKMHTDVEPQSNPAH